MLWPIDYWNLIDIPQRVIANKFAQEIASLLNLPRREYSMKERWQSHPPEDAGHQSLDEYMLKASPALHKLSQMLNFTQATQDMWYDDFHAFDYFRELYWATYRRGPYLTPPVHAAWASCASITRSERDEAERRVHVFHEWFQAQFFAAERPLLVMPIENVRPRYRDVPPE